MPLFAGLLLAATTARVGAEEQLLAARGDRTCASHADGALYCWGGGEYTSRFLAPVRRLSARLVMFADDSHCLIDRHDRMSCGDSSADPDEMPGAILELYSVQARDVAVDARHGCHAAPTGAVSCWPWERGGVFGVEPIGGYRAIPIAITDAIAIAALSTVQAGETSSFCALRRNGAVDCWSPDCPRMPLIRAYEGAAELSAGGVFCARARTGGVACWEYPGDLCDGVSRPSARPVAGAADAADIEVGETLACMLDSRGRTSCWSLLPEHAATMRAVAQSGAPEAIALAVGGSHACVRSASDDVWCWGAATAGQLNDREYLDEIPEPSLVEGIDDAVALAATDTRICALLADRHVDCWGATSDGAAPPGWSGAPRRMHGIDDAVGLFARGFSELCVVHANGAHTCSADRLPGTTIRYPWGEQESCQVDLAGHVWCEGLNVRGERGCDTLDVSFTTPTRVCGLDAPAVEVSRGRRHACARLADRTVSCWGDNLYFQLGQAAGDATLLAGDFAADPWYSPRPLRVPGVDNVTQILAAGDASCALHVGGAVSCWGSNRTGQCGYGSGEFRDDPVRVVLPPDRTLMAVRSRQ